MLKQNIFTVTRRYDMVPSKLKHTMQMVRQVFDAGKCFHYSVRMLAAVCRKGGNKTL
jgi:hypothetical protein